MSGNFRADRQWPIDETDHYFYILCIYISDKKTVLHSYNIENILDVWWLGMISKIY
jgi:hypothetical protein